MLDFLILGDYNSGCIAYDNNNFSSITSGSISNTGDFFSNLFNNPCNATNKFYTVYAFVEDGDSTRGIEPTIIRVGQPFAYSPKVKIEYDFYVDYNLWNIDSTKKSFSRSNPSFNLDIEKSSNSDQISQANSSFTANDDNGLINNILTNMITYRNSDTTQFPIYLNIAYSAVVPGLTLLGVSYSKLYDNENRNFSYVFGHNIAIRFGEAYWNNHADYKKSTVSYTICHELLHQICNAIFLGVHTDHDRDSCVLNDSYIYYDDTSYNSGRMSWIVCPKHFNWLMGSPFITNQTNDNLAGGQNLILDSENGHSAINQSKSELSITLPKYSFKKYEPIMAKLEYINKNSVNDTVNYMFNEWDDDNFIFSIKPLDGQNYARVQLPFSMSFGPNQYIISPNDTFEFSRNINRFGNKFVNTSKYFGMHGYFLPGKYEVTAKGKNNNDNLVSNTIEFEVADNTSEDNSILELLTQNQYQTIILNYPDNPLTEAVYAYYVHSSFIPSPSFKDNFTKNDVVDLYKGFFNKYPNSIYNYNPLFVYSIFWKIGLQSSDIESEEQFFKNVYPNSTLEKFLNQEQPISQINKLYNTTKKNYEDFLNK